jgi:hypothetical protein
MPFLDSYIKSLAILQTVKPFGKTHQRPNILCYKNTRIKTAGLADKQSCLLTGNVKVFILSASTEASTP